jgi:hypothetical protein
VGDGVGEGLGDGFGVGDGEGLGFGVGVGVGDADTGVGVGVGDPEAVVGEEDADVLFVKPQPARNNKAQVMPDKMKTLKPGRKARSIYIPPGRTGRLLTHLLWLYPAHTYLRGGKTRKFPSRVFEQLREISYLSPR